MECHRKQYIKSKHPFVSSINISESIGSSMSYMLRRIWVRICNSEKELWFIRIHISIVKRRIFPFSSPFMFNVRPINCQKITLFCIDNGLNCINNCIMVGNFRTATLGKTVSSSARTTKGL